MTKITPKYRAKVVIQPSLNRGGTIAYAIYNVTDGGIVFTDNTGTKAFYNKNFWDSVYQDLNIANTYADPRVNIAGHPPLKPIWGNINNQPHGYWS